MKKVILSVFVLFFVFSFSLTFAANDPVVNCTLTTDKSDYSLGDTITYSWVSTNATYATWRQDNSGKDSFYLPGDKLSANGNQKIIASVTGNPTVSLMVSNGNTVATCSRTIRVSDEINSDFADLNLSVSTNKVQEGSSIAIRFNDIGADYYILSAACKDSVSVGGKARPDICFEGEKIYPTGKDVILVDGFYPRASGGNSAFHLEVKAFVGKKSVKNDIEVVEISNTTKDSGNLSLSVNQYEDKISNSSNPKIRFNDIGADHYSIDAKCDTGVSMVGTYPFNCVTGKGGSEKVYPTGKDVILFDGFKFSNNTKENKNVTIYISARNSDDSIISSDSVDFKLYSGDVKTDKNEIKKGNDDQVGKDTLKMIVSLLKGIHKDGSANQVIQILELIISILEKA